MGKEYFEDDTDFQYPAKTAIYELADRAAFDDLLRAGYTNQVIGNTRFLAKVAMEASRECPEFKEAFVYEVATYVKKAMRYVEED